MRKAAILAALLGLAIAGCSTQTGSTGTTATAGGSPTTSSSKGSSKSVNVPIGTSIHVTGTDNLSADVTILKVDYFKQGKGEIAQSPQNGQYAVADASVKVTSGKYPFNTLYFKYQAQDGKTFDPFAGHATSAGFEPSLSAGELSGGQTTRGMVVFDVPIGKGQVIQLTDPLGSVIGQWTL
jgi:Domain of unknown function (DUF4352)